MTYCRKCGAKLDVDARFCRACGAPTESAAATQEPYRPRGGRPNYLPVAILLAVMGVVFVVGVFFFVPVQDGDFSRSYSVPASAGVDSIVLTFNADVADVNVIPADLPNEFVRVDVSARGTTGFFGSGNEPVKVTLSHDTGGNSVLVNSRVERTEVWPFSFNLRVVCNVYVSRGLALDVNAQTSVGSISIEPSNPVVFRGLTLRSTTGSVDAVLTDLVVLTRNVSISTTTGSIRFAWNNVRVSAPLTLRLATTTGSVHLTLSHHRALAGTVTIDARTTTGSVNPTVTISGEVGAQITSRTTLGSISTSVQNFNGDKSPIYSSNYPAENNFLINAETTTGSVNINAAYQGNQVPPLTEREQIRDAVMSYIRVNHDETARFMQNLTWTGGRVETGGVGSEVYSYFGNGWNVTITNPVVPNPAYTVTADYSSPQLGIPYRIIWSGTWRKGDITETSYVFAQ